MKSTWSTIWNGVFCIESYFQLKTFLCISSNSVRSYLVIFTRKHFHGVWLGLSPKYTNESSKHSSLTMSAVMSFWKNSSALKAMTNWRVNSDFFAKTQRWKEWGWKPKYSESRLRKKKKRLNSFPVTINLKKIFQ